MKKEKGYKLKRRSLRKLIKEAKGNEKNFAAYFKNWDFEPGNKNVGAFKSFLDEKMIIIVKCSFRRKCQRC